MFLVFGSAYINWGIWHHTYKQICKGQFFSLWWRSATRRLVAARYNIAVTFYINKLGWKRKGKDNKLPIIYALFVGIIATNMGKLENGARPQNRWVLSDTYSIKSKCKSSIFSLITIVAETKEAGANFRFIYKISIE